MSFTIKELREVSDEELIKRHDELSKTTYVGIQYYLDELHRRDSERTNRTMKIVAFCSLAVATISLKYPLFPRLLNRLIRMVISCVL